MKSLERLCCVLLLGGSMLATGCDNPAPATDAGADTGADPGDGGNDAALPDDDGGGIDAAIDDAGIDAAPPIDGGPPPAARTLPTNGSAIVMTSDDAVMVACNREAGSVSVFTVAAGTPPTVTRTVELDFAGDEPWAAVIGNDDDTAYVILRASGEIVRIDDLHTAPALASFRGDVGSEPTGIAISPLGGTIWVANWSDGTVSMVNPSTLAVGSSVDLNAMLVATGSVGAIGARAGLAHPRAIAITNDGDTDEFDESVFVTEYFGQARTDTLPTDDSRFDVARRGIVYELNALGVAQGTIPIEPVTDTGFTDSLGNTTGCFPNQLLAAAIANGRLYVTGVCASPRGPTGPILDAATNLPVAGPTGTANFKTEIHTTVWAIDTATSTEIPAQRVVLPRAFQTLYEGTTPPTPDDGANRRIPLIANDIAFVPGTTIAYLTSYGSDAVFRVQYDAAGALVRVGAPATSFINLAPTGMPAGRLPYGIAIGSTGGSGFAYVINEATRNVSTIGFSTQALLGATQSSTMPAPDSAEAHVLEGRRFFVTGLGRWSFRGQGWNSCEACHGDGLTDNVTWYFGRGPRQSTSLDGSFDSADPTQQRLFNWTAIFDEVHDFELNTRGNSGGVGAVVHTTSTPAAVADRIHFDGTTPVPAGQMATTTPQAGLNGSVDQLMPDGAITPHSTLADWDRVEAYMRAIRSPNAPSQLAGSTDVDAGAALFATHNCTGCHGTSMWTISRRFWTPGESTNHPTTGLLRTTSYVATGFPAMLNPPSAGAGRTATLRFPAGATAGANDQIQCVLRSVGTFTGTTPVIVAGSGVQLSEVRTDMTTTAQGASGFNPPSLLGLGTGAPYFHGGNARSLEEVFDTAFAAHYQAMSVNFLTNPATRDMEVRQITAYLLSIDESTAPVSPPTSAALGYNPLLCPTSLP